MHESSVIYGNRGHDCIELVACSISVGVRMFQPLPPNPRPEGGEFAPLKGEPFLHFWTRYL